MKKAFSLIELILVISLTAFLAGGGFVIIDKIYESYSRSKGLNSLLNESHMLSLQLGALLSNRIPSSVIGYDMKTAEFESVYISFKSYKILEWIGFAKESFKKGEFSSFLDMKRCDRSSDTLFSLDTNLSLVGKTVSDKFSKSGDIFTDEYAVLIFSGSFDEGASPYLNGFKDFYGWHGRGSKEIFPIKKATENEYFQLKKHPKKIYEKYFLADSGYAVARGEDIDLKSECIKKLPIKVSSDTLFLFYDFRPWKGESFCADKNSAKKSGAVTVLSLNVKGFEVEVNNEALILDITFVKQFKKDGNITLSIQKVIL